MRVAFYTLGCKVNQYETEIMSSQFAQDGFDVVNHEDEADVYIINSCTVTAAGDKKTKQLIKRFKQRNQSAIVALTGCFPQAFPDEAEALGSADVIQGSYNRTAILSNVKKALATRERIIDITPHQSKEQFEPMSATKFTDHSLHLRTRAFVKIEDGCDRYCSYCIIPKARGPIRSKELLDIKSEVEGLVKNGYKEIVLVGINLSSYGKEKGDIRLIDAIKLVASIDGVERVRLGSLEPELLTDSDIAEMAAEKKFCPQFHLSLQSGSDDTLKRMNRHYTSAEYMDIVRKIRNQFKNPSITTDIMVGFAGETEQEFAESLEFMKAVQFARVHVFSYSIRKGTRAAEFKDQVDKSVKEHRSKLMSQAAIERQREFLGSQLGEICEVLFETKLDLESYVGYTKNYTKVIAQSKEDLCGKIVAVRLDKVCDDYCTATHWNSISLG